jgi:hypothetical protein
VPDRNMAILNRIWFFLAAIWLTICAALDQPAREVLKPAIMPKQMPDSDEWYRPPQGFEKELSGTILKYRFAPRGLSLNNKDALKIHDHWQILYRTQNTVGEPEANVVSLVVPTNANTNNLFMYNWFSVRNRCNSFIHPTNAYPRMPASASKQNLPRRIHNALT